VADTTEWIELEHEDTGGRQKVPNVPDVLAVQASKGWHPVDEDDAPDLPWVPTPGDAAPDAEWVTLVHPDLPLGTNVVPNNPEALQGAYDAGWQLPAPPEGAVQEILAEAHPRGGRATAAEREQAEHDAAVQAAATDDPAEPAAVDDEREE
jgi:hypothetical protein